MPTAPLFQAFVTFLNINFYTLIIPFKLRLDPNSGLVVSVRARGCHKAIFITVWTIGGLANLIAILSKPPPNPEDHSTALKFVVDTLTNIGWTVLNFIVKFETWRGPESFALLTSKLLQIEREMIQMKVPPRRILRCPGAVAIFLYVLSVTVNVWEVAANCPLFVAANMSVVIREAEVRRPSATVSAIYAIRWGFKIYENQVTSFGSISVLLLSVALYCTTRTYLSYLKGNILRRAENVPCACKLMVELSSEIKNTFGCTVAGVILLLLCYYSHRVQDIFSGSASVIARYCFYMCRLVSTLFFGAQAHAQFQAILQPWISMEGENLGNAGNIKMKAILVDMVQRDGFGIRGRNFTVTYTFFGSIMAAILAYSIAIVQLQSS